MQAVKKNQYLDVTSGALLPKILLFTIPLVLSGILQLLFNTADTIVVGRWGGETAADSEVALAAVGSCGALIALFVQFFMGLSVGAGVCVAQDLGAKLYADVRKTVHTAVLLALIFGVGIGGMGFFLARPLLLMMGTESAVTAGASSSVLDQATLYMKAYFVGTPANMVYNYCAAVLRAKGDTTRPMIFLSVGGVVNVILNLVMVLVFHAGALGVGIATAASQWVACVLVVFYMLRLDDACRLELKELRFHKRKLKRILAIGIPAGIQSTVFAFSNVLIQSTVNSFGKSAVAANAAAGNIIDYVWIAMTSFTHAVLTFVGQSVGARRWDRIRPIMVRCIACVMVVGLGLGMVSLLLGEQLLGVYAPGNAEVVRLGMKKIRILGVLYFLGGLMELGSGLLRGLGRSIIPMYVGICGTCVFRVVWILAVFPSFQTLEALYYSYPISWLLTAATYFLLASFSVKKMAGRQEPPPEASN